MTKKYVPSCHSCLCMKHFEDNQFVIGPRFAQQIGYSQPLQLRLKSDAVPTIFETPGKSPKKDRKSASAIAKKKLVNEVSYKPIRFHIVNADFNVILQSNERLFQCKRDIKSAADKF